MLGRKEPFSSTYPEKKSSKVKSFHGVSVYITKPTLSIRAEDNEVLHEVKGSASHGIVVVEDVETSEVTTE